MAQALLKRILPIALIAFAVAYIWLATEIPLDPWSEAEAINSRTLPIIYGVLLAICATALLVRGNQASAVGKNRWQLAGLSVAIVCFGLVLPVLGLWLAIIILLSSSLAIMGERRWTVLLAAPIATALVGWLIVEVGLDIYLQPGSLWSAAGVVSDAALVVWVHPWAR